MIIRLLATNLTPIESEVGDHVIASTMTQEPSWDRGQRGQLGCREAFVVSSPLSLTHEWIGIDQQLLLAEGGCGCVGVWVRVCAATKRCSF